ncbi:MAG: hypothetical protein ACM3OO_10155 [Planctomycetaceae bacterium]
MPRPDRIPELRSAREMAAIFRMKERRWRKVARKQRFPHYKVGTSTRWDVNEVLWICRRESGGNDPN